MRPALFRSVETVRHDGLKINMHTGIYSTSTGSFIGKHPTYGLRSIFLLTGFQGSPCSNTRMPLPKICLEVGDPLERRKASFAGICVGALQSKHLGSSASGFLK